MKKLFTLFGMLLMLSTFAQNALEHVTNQKYYAAPNSGRPNAKHGSVNSTSRSGIAVCDTSDVLDYSTYNEYFAGQVGLTFHGSWNTQSPQPYAQELTSFIDTASANNSDFSYAMVAFDSIAFADITNNATQFYPLSASTIYVDSLGMFVGIWGDTSANGKMLHDSVVI
ncbi:MAG: hypothetical protein JWO06_3909, partial [Bacteroidota bacterium]|nr:hypothetical protein [Bacteroidota bacterium]